MGSKKEYFQIALLFLIVIVYIALDNNAFVTATLLLISCGITLYILGSVKEKLNEERKDREYNLQYKLKKSRKENEEAYKRFLNLSTTLGSGVFMVNEYGIIDFSNKDIENFFGIDFNNMDYTELVKIRPLYYFIDEAYLTEEYYRKEIKYNEHNYDLISTPLFEGDMYAGCMVIVHDITQLKSAEKFQKRFTADVSHELRTPLSAIKGFSEIMARDESMDEEHRHEFIETINKEANKMEVILNDLMVISRLDRIDYEMDLHLHDIADVIQENANLLAAKIEEKGLKLNVQVESCEMYYDKVKLAQVIVNIIKNAVSYTDKGFIDVTGRTLGKKYIIQVEDTGIGIAPKDMEKIFTRFYRVDKARSRDTGGSGLGLSISKNVVLKHNGTIDVSSNEGKGTIFTITLPIKK